ncbi:hypothetical protein NQZ68_016921, partial [Dissostichus eleginoides]
IDKGTSSVDALTDSAYTSRSWKRAQRCPASQLTLDISFGLIDGCRGCCCFPSEEITKVHTNSPEHTPPAEWLPGCEDMTGQGLWDGAGG